MNLKLVSGLVLCGAFAVACGDSGSNTAGGTSGGGDPQGGGTDGGSTGVFGGNPPVGGDGPTGGMPPEAPDCYDGGEALSVPDGIWSGVTINQGVCDATQIGGALTECFDPGTMATCEAWNTANPECSLCIFGGAQKDAPFPIPALIGSNNATYLALYACQAFASDLPQCAVQYQNLLFCASTACESCDPGDEDTECTNYALNDPEVCGALPFDDACLPLFDATELPAECIGNATTFETAYPILADYFCGSP